MERTITVTFSDEEAEYLDSRIGDNGYADEASLVRASVKRMKAHDDWLRAEVQKGIDDFEAGRYKTYASAQELVDDIMRDDD